MELVLVSAEWFAWIWITINIQMKDVLLSPDLMLWRTATHSPALVHKVSFFMVTDCVCEPLSGQKYSENCCIV